MKKIVIHLIASVGAIAGVFLVVSTQNSPEKVIETKSESKIQGVKSPSQFTAEEIKNMPMIESIATVISYELEDMPNTADLIVVAEAVKPYEDREYVANYGETLEDEIQPVFFTGGHTKTEVTIKEVIKPSAKNDVSEGDVITIKEPLTIFQEPSGDYVRYAAENYVALDDTSTYLLFLVQPDPESNTYGLQNFNEGRFSIDDPNELEKGLVEARMEKLLKSSSEEGEQAVEDMIEKHKLFKDYLFNHFEEELKGH